MSFNQSRSQDLVARAQGGEAGAFGELFERQVPRLLTFIRLRLSAQLAVRLEPLDVLQETGLGAFQSIGDFEARGRGAFGRWLCAIAENRIRDGADYLGAAKRLPPGQLEAISVVLERACQTVTGPATRAARDDRSEKLGGLLEELEPELRQALVMRFFRGSTTEEIARELGCSETSARRRIARGTEVLGARLGEEEL